MEAHWLYYVSTCIMTSDASCTKQCSSSLNIYGLCKWDYITKRSWWTLFLVMSHKNTQLNIVESELCCKFAIELHNILRNMKFKHKTKQHAQALVTRFCYYSRYMHKFWVTNFESIYHQEWNWGKSSWKWKLRFLSLNDYIVVALHRFLSVKMKQLFPLIHLRYSNIARLEATPKIL